LYARALPNYRGEVYSLARYAGVKTKECSARLADHSDLQSVDQVKADIARGMSRKLEGFIKGAEADAKQRMAMLDFRKGEMASRHKDERAKLKTGLEKR